MKAKLIRHVLRQRVLLGYTFVCLLLGNLECHAHDIDQRNPIPAKNKAPINYYQALMISVAGCYGIYLVVRARRKKTDNTD